MRLSDLEASTVEKIRLVIFDVDGVLTDGGLYYFNNGNSAKKFYVKDGTGIRRLILAGLHVAFITGLESNIVSKRAADLGVKHVIQGCHDKEGAARELKDTLGLDWSEVAYLGDDLIDLKVMKKVGLPVAVSDAANEIKLSALASTDLPGGRGAARELCDLLLGHHSGS